MNSDNQRRTKTLHSKPNHDVVPQECLPDICGIGQLSLVEHALCPLDATQSLRPGQCHEFQYHYTPASGERRPATARLWCPAGLSPSDEFFLWGLLGLTFLTGCPDGELHATPHYCLRQLGLIDSHSRRGGRQYQQFAESLERLSLVKYRNDGFFDPLRREHRRVSFGFLSYSLPLDPQSSRAWRIVWDTMFLELVRPLGGHLAFDWDVYRQLDPASRRLFLLLSKIFRRRTRSPLWNLQELAVHTLGFSANVAVRDLKVKVTRCVNRLAAQNVVTPDAQAIQRTAPRQYRVQLRRGPYFERQRRVRQSQMPKPLLKQSPFYEPLLELELDDRTIARLLADFDVRMLREWLDITLAAKERFGAKFFKRSPAAFLIDNLRHAKRGLRTPPDWWHRLKRMERKASATRSPAPDSGPARLGEAWLKADGPEIIQHLTAQFLAAGQLPEKAKLNAERIAEELQRRRCRKPA